MADYVQPDALCVPISNFDISATLTRVARDASERTGVIIVTSEPIEIQAFIETQPHAAHFGVVSGYFDSPWLRDHAPVAVHVGGDIENVRLARHDDDRTHDLNLFPTIFPGLTQVTPHLLAGGNLVAGPDGLAVSTFSVLEQNGLTCPHDLAETAQVLGIRDWLFVPAFADDISAHTDTSIRFLGPNLAAFCDRQDAIGRDVSAQIAREIRQLRPDIDLVALPCRAGTTGFDSPLNWIQLDDLLLMPDFGNDDPLQDLRQSALTSHGFEVRGVGCETSGLGGGLHCLTASVFAGG